MQKMSSRIPVSSFPVSRSWHTLTTVSDSSLFLFGGLSIDCKPMSKKTYSLMYLCTSSNVSFNKTHFLLPSGDGWLFDVETKEWREVEHPFKDKPRYQNLNMTVHRFFLFFIFFMICTKPSIFCPLQGYGTQHA